MADALRYLATTAEAKSYEVEPLSAVTSAKLETACDLGEDAVDQYLAGKGMTTPITLASLADTQQDLLKRAAAKMVGYILYSQHQQYAMAKIVKKSAEALLDKFIAAADLDHTTVVSHMGVVNAQEEYVDDWNDPNDTLENMDE